MPVGFYYACAIQVQNKCVMCRISTVWSDGGRKIVPCILKLPRFPAYKPLIQQEQQQQQRAIYTPHRFNEVADNQKTDEVARYCTIICAAAGILVAFRI